MVYKYAEQRFIDKPNALETVLAHMVGGGTLEDFCGLKRLRLQAVWAWLMSDDTRRQAYEEARGREVAMDKERMRWVLRAIAFGDVRELLADDGSLLPVSKWPAAAARLVAALDIEETSRKEDVEVALKKVKLSDRQRAIELLAKLDGHMAPEVVQQRVTLERLVAEPMEGEPKL